MNLVSPAGRSQVFLAGMNAASERFCPRMWTTLYRERTVEFHVTHLPQTFD